MHPRLSRRGVLLAGPLALAFVLGALAFGPAVRAVAMAQASRRHLELEVHGVRPAWFGVRLLGVVVRAQGMPSVQARIDEVHAVVGWTLHLERVDLHGVAVEARGGIDVLRDEFAAWRSLGATDPSARRDPARTPATLSLEALSLRWVEEDPANPRAEFEGVAAEWGADGLRWRAPRGRARFGFGEIAVTDGTGLVDRAGSLEQARASALTVEVDQSTAPPRPDPSTDPSPRPTTPLPAADPAAPLLPVPDLHVLRAKVFALASVLAERIHEGADIGVDALTWKIVRPRDQVAFTLGPGPLDLASASTGFELRFSTDPHGTGTPLAVRAVLPRMGDPTFSLEGGPISLSLLGVQEGAAGLVDVARTTVTGRAHVVLADDGSAVTFDGEGGARSLSLSSPRLATDVVRGLDLQIHARGAATAEGDLRLDDFAASFGSVHIAAGGVLEQRPDHVAGAFHFDVPNASCQSLLDSLPGALLPALQGTRIAGDFGARGRFGFDTRALDDLELDYQVNDRCHVTQVPAELARERFQQTFTHRIYLPDGTIAEETTGPGTDNWTPLDEISPYMQVAVLTTEDGAFPKHHGFNRASIRSSIVANLKARRFARGASTITMQLAKNLFLSRDKTLSRKLEEVVLTDYLEQTFSKDELMELYLNVIEFGPSVYGITAAADHYFGRTPAELNLSECLFLSSLLPAPLRYGAMRENGEVSDGWMRTLRALMQIAHRNGRINDAELAEGQKETIEFWRGGDRPSARPPVRAHLQVNGETDDATTAPGADPPPSP
jgi:hypothetical protein